MLDCDKIVFTDQSQIRNGQYLDRPAELLYLVFPVKLGLEGSKSDDEHKGGSNEHANWRISGRTSVTASDVAQQEASLMCPAFGEAASDLLFRHPAGPLRSRLVVAEAKQV